eukprot:361415-Chlamydomonas_euryale.AAC.12
MSRASMAACHSPRAQQGGSARPCPAPPAAFATDAAATAVTAHPGPAGRRVPRGDGEDQDPRGHQDCDVHLGRGQPLPTGHRALDGRQDRQGAARGALPTP